MYGEVFMADASREHIGRGFLRKASASPTTNRWKLTGPDLSDCRHAELIIVEGGTTVRPRRVRVAVEGIGNGCAWVRFIELLTD